MKETEEDRLMEDLILISQKKNKIKATMEFTRKAHETYLTRQRRNRIRLWTISISSAAAILLLSLVVMPSFFAFDGTTEFNELYTKFESGIATRGSVPSDPATEVVTLYSNGQFQKALAKADSLLYSQPENTGLLFFNGLTAMELGQTDQSIRMFTQVIPRGGSYEMYSRWYLALIYLRQENFAACRDQLSTLKKINGRPYEKQIDKLYRKLRFRKNQ